MLTAAVPEARLAVHESGHGRPVVFVHGGTATASHEWSSVVPALHQDHRVVTLDIRGHGASRNVGGDLTMARFALDLEHVMGRLGIGNATFVGFSLGANTVLALLARRPERAVAAMLVGGSATGDPDRIRGLAGGPWPDELRSQRHVNGGQDYWDRLRGALLEDWARNAVVPTAVLARVRCRVLVVRGASDTVQPGDAAADLARRLPLADRVTVDGAGHPVHHDRPGAFLRLLRDLLRTTCPERQR